MARRNRKKNDAGFVNHLPWALTLALIAAFALAYVHLHDRAGAIGRELKALEIKRDQLREQILKQQCAWARLQSPINLEQALREQGLVMTWPNRDQIVRVRADGTVDSSSGPESRTPTRYARVDRVVMND